MEAEKSQTADGPAQLGFGGSPDGPPVPLSLGGTAGPENIVFEGYSSLDAAGITLSDIGDFNGDGYPDFIAGAHRAYGTENGTAFLVRGGAWLASLAGPVDLNAQLSTSITGIYGEAAYDRAGRAVSSAGDVNGDGLADLIVGAYGSDAAHSGAGSAYIIFGSASTSWGLYLAGVRAGAYPGVALDGGAASDYAGFAVSSAGDFNGDGLDDVLIGAYGADPNGLSTAGKAYVVFGRETWVGTGHSPESLDGLVASGDAAEILGAHAGGFLGYSVSGAGDFNGDGLGDVIVGARRAPSNSGNYAGRAYVVYGRTSGFSIDVGSAKPGTTEVIGRSAADYLGYSVAGGGDFNRDGFDDVLIGAPYEDSSGGSNAGAAYVVLGSKVGNQALTINKYVLEKQAVELHGAAAGDLFGYSVGMGADFNSDGLDDVLVGAPSADPGAQSSAGTTYLAYGADDPSVSDQPIYAEKLAKEVGGLPFDGEAPSDAAGRSVDFVQPMSGGTEALVAVGAPFADRDASTSNSGRAYVMRPDPLTGQYHALNRSPDTTLDVYYGEQGETLVVSAPGVLDNDVDHDGDPLSVDPDQQVTAEGCTVDFFADGSFSVSPPSASWWGVCRAVYTAEDDSVGRRDEDLLVVYSLSDLFAGDIVLAQAGMVWNGEVAGDGAGQSVDVVPDVSGDGRDEFLVGAYGHDGSGPWAGRAYLVLGQDISAELDLSSVVSGVGGGAIDGETAFDWLGLEVASAGDFNADGEPELLVGAIGHDGVGERSGRLYQVDASELMANSPATAGQLGVDFAAYDGASSLDDAGRSAGSAGDFNGDGIPDIHISSYRADASALDMEGFPIAEEVGVVYVVFGSPGVLGSGVVDLDDVGSSVPGVRIEGVGDGDFAGFSVTSIGDINGDGFDELAIGAYAADTDLGGTDSGRVYIVYGSNSVTEIDLLDLEENVGSLGVVLDGGEPFELAGRVVAGLGDINDDGAEDLLVGAPGADEGTGCAYVIFGAPDLGGASAMLSLPDLIADEAGMIFHGAEVGDGLGSNGSRLGDFNGDGRDDFAVSAPYANGPSVVGSGRVYVVFGGEELTAQYVPVSELSASDLGFSVSGAEAGDAFGHGVAGGRDINGDGFDDLVVGAYEASLPSGDRAGRAYVVFGRQRLADLIGELL